ncbi:MAG: bifunctional riboflavin kinase/FAD synthetase [Bacteroidota bacterium]|nr:bifunctional riboflavin kinase/FAD synthetase [Bacteroidota bacterium]MDP3431924.1 bifunctional riboflavin kinase/FAD synthetase [Bacteroidota bacterium]
MKIHRNLNSFHAQNPVLTIGTFDGVHLGHRKIIARLHDLAKTINGESVIFTFDPHPRKIVAPGETTLRLLTTLEEKIVLFEQSGIDHLIIYPFTTEFSKLTYEEFVEQVLVGQIHTKFLVVGYDHKFGKNRQGDFEFLKKCAERHEFEIEKLDVLLMNESQISSTKIREAIQKGDFDAANAFLGYPFTLHGTVVEGQKLGRKIQFPTANIQTSDPDKIIPGYGVYAVEITVMNQKFNGMLNIGSRPTVNNNADNRSIEVHIFDFESDIYGEAIELVFFKKLREEQKFLSIDALKDQLVKDKTDTISWFQDNL